MQEIIDRSSYQVGQYNALAFNYISDFSKFIDAKPNTINTYKKAVKQLYVYLHDNDISRPTRADIIDFREYLKKDHKNTTVQTYMIAIKLFFKWLNSLDLYPNIADNVKGAKISREHKKDYFTAEQTKAILKGINLNTDKGKRDFAIIALMVTGGLRDNEVINANIEDIRAAGNNTVLYILGKGRDDKAEYIKIVPNVENAIREYLKTRTIKTVKEPLFASVSNNNAGGRMTTKSISRLCKEYMKKAGFNSDRLTAHSFRHTSVTLALLGGMDLQEVQQFARHRNITTTQIYAHNIDRLQNKCEETIATSIF